jgi:single-stranded-DNA-specific exonuclease
MPRPAKRRTADGLPPATASEAAFEKLLANFPLTEPVPSEPSDASDKGASAGAFLDELYANRGRYLERDPYATIGDSHGFNTKVVGITFEGRQDLAAGIRPGEVLHLVREPNNAYDPNAIAVRYGQLALGYLRKEIAVRVAPNIDAGERYTAEVKHVTGGGTRSIGINIWVERARAAVARPQHDGSGGAGDVLAALIGTHPLRDAQRAVLDRVAAKRNTLAVLGTGRGKSLCFQYPAAVGALERRERTVVLYPLRALANDQHDALLRRLEPLGVRILRANGAIDIGERATLMDALETGAWDIILATPEFVHYHRARFAEPRSRPSLLVVDEAHHLVESTNRPAYGRIGEVLAALGNPQVLALTATAGDEVFDGIRTALGIEAWVIDPTVRENLHVIDARGTTNKPAYIEKNLDAEGKAIIYCNSRNEVTKIAEKLRAHIGNTVAFYHAGIPPAERTQVETFFRSGEIRYVVATSAFGEGIDLPDVRDVFLYHLNFDMTSFNQQAGRAGRDGAAARIHLLFGERDRNINDFIIERTAPTVHTLRAVYKGLRGIASDGMVRMTIADIAATLDIEKVAKETVAVAWRIFADVGLVELGEDDDGRYARFLDVAEKVDLTASERFAEGEAERESFARFCSLVLTAQPETLQSVINRPIYPGNVPHLR